MLAVIFWLVSFVVTAQLAPVDVTKVGASPATAVRTVSDGAPLKAIWLIALTCSVTVCVAVPCADADAAAATARRPAISERESFIFNLQEGGTGRGERMSLLARYHAPSRW